MPKVNRKKFKTNLTAEDLYDKLLEAWDWSNREDRSLFEWQIENILEEAGLVFSPPHIENPNEHNYYTDLVVEDNDSNETS